MTSGKRLNSLAKVVKAELGATNAPLPLLFDLRAYQKARKKGEQIQLGDILDACIESVRSSEGADWEFEAEDVIRSVREQGSVAIFDGLDKVTQAWFAFG